MPTPSANPEKEIEVVCAGAVKAIVSELARAFTQTNGTKVSLMFDRSGVVKARVLDGEIVDAVITTKAAIDELARHHKVALDSITTVAHSAIGVAIRTGASKPDIGSAAAFKRTLLNAKSIAHTMHGASGMYVPVLMERLGIAERMKPKTVTRPGGYIARVVASGEAEVAIQQIVELLAVPGVDLVGPLPDAIQKVFETAAGIFTATRQPAAAEALLRFLLAPAAAGVFREKGLEQVENR